MPTVWTITVKYPDNTTEEWSSSTAPVEDDIKIRFTPTTGGTVTITRAQVRWVKVSTS